MASNLRSALAADAPGLAQHWAALEAADGRPVKSMMQEAAGTMLDACCGSGSIAAAAAAALAVRAGWLRDICWEKLHTGYWRDVPTAWRDAYTLSCLLWTAAHEAPASSCSDGGAAGPCAAGAARPEGATASASARDSGSSSETLAGRLLRCLDMAALMGGPRFRSVLDSVIAHVQPFAVAATAPAAEDGANLAFKRRKVGGSKPNAVPCGAAPASVKRTLHAPARVPLPPGSVCGAGSLLQPLPAPCLEDFLEACVCGGLAGTGRPALISGAMDDWPALERWQNMEYLKQARAFRVMWDMCDCGVLCHLLLLPTTQHDPAIFHSAWYPVQLVVCSWELMLMFVFSKASVPAFRPISCSYCSLQYRCVLFAIR